MTLDNETVQKKALADIAKVEAEAEAVREKVKWESAKLAAEVRELRKPFWHRPGFYAALLPALATIATIGWTVFSGTLKEYLQAQETKSKADLKVIEAETKLLEYEKAKFADQAEGLKTEIAESRARLAELEVQLERAALDSIIKGLRDESAITKSWPNSDFERLAHEIRAFAEPKRALEIVEQAMADVSAVPVQAKLLYSYYRATGEADYLARIPKLIVLAEKEQWLGRGFWDLAAPKWDGDGDEPEAHAVWRLNMCNTVMHAFGRLAGSLSEHLRSDLIFEIEVILSACRSIESLNPGSLEREAIVAMSAGAAGFYRPGMGTFEAAFTAKFVAASNVFAGMLIALEVWSNERFREDKTFILSNVLEFADPNWEDPQTLDPKREYWEPIFQETKHLIPMLVNTPFADWPTEPDK